MSDKPQPDRQDREARLAAALRENLKRRKEAEKREADEKKGG